MRSLERQKEMREKTGNMTDFKKNLDKFLCGRSHYRFLLEAEI